MFPAEVAANPSVPPWVGFVLTLIGALLGTGGIAAILKAKYDYEQGVDAHEIVEEDAIASRWEALSKAQVEMLLNPLRERLSEVEGKVKGLEIELDASRKKYWTAIPYIRTLLGLFHRHAPEVALPPVPASIADDV